MKCTGNSPAFRTLPCLGGDIASAKDSWGQHGLEEGQRAAIPSPGMWQEAANRALSWGSGECGSIQVILWWGGDTDDTCPNKKLECETFHKIIDFPVENHFKSFHRKVSI